MAASIPSTSVPTISSNGKVKVLANVQSDNKSGFVGEKSLKSQRTYQVGVVYKDIYGRETPVFTSGSGSLLKKLLTNITTHVWIDGMMLKMRIFG